MSPVTHPHIRYLINLPASIDNPVITMLARKIPRPTENTSPITGSQLKKANTAQSPSQLPAVATRMADVTSVPVAIKTESSASELKGTTVAARKLARNNPGRPYSKSPSANAEFLIYREHT